MYCMPLLLLLIVDTVLIVGWPSIDIEVLLSSVLKML